MVSDSVALRSPSGAGADEGGTARPADRRRGGVLYFVATLVSQGCALLRYVVLARLLGPEQLGIAATLVVTASFFDLISDMGGDRFVIQDRDGGAVEVQNLVQAVSVGRGVLISLGLLIFAAPIAYFYNTPPLAKGLAILAIAPVINGFAHLDNRRVQREHDFRAEALSTMFGEMAGLAGTVTAALLTHSFTAILYGIITRSVVTVLTSHLQARRPYRLAWSRQHWPRLARFAIPLMLNGLMVFVASQGDRVIVGQQLGVKALGYYSAVMLLIYYPTALLIRYQFAVNIPLIAAHRDQPAGRERSIDMMGGQTLLLTIAMAVGFAIVAPVAVPILFGGRFAQAPLLIGLIGCLQTTRVMFNWPTTVALATGRSTTVLFGNLAHGFAFAGAFLGLKVAGGLAGLVSGFVAGEILAVGGAMALVNRNMNRAWFQHFDRLGACILTFGLIIGSIMLLDARLWWAVACMIAGWAALAVWLFRQEGAVIKEIWAMARHVVSPLLIRPGP